MATGPKTGQEFTGDTHPIRANGFPASEQQLPGSPFTAPPAAGTPVWVNAFGAWRQGAVIRPARSRVRVEYARSRAGVLAEASVPLWRVRARLGG